MSSQWTSLDSRPAPTSVVVQGSEGLLPWRTEAEIYWTNFCDWGKVGETMIHLASHFILLTRHHNPYYSQGFHSNLFIGHHLSPLSYLIAALYSLLKGILTLIYPLNIASHHPSATLTGFPILTNSQASLSFPLHPTYWASHSNRPTKNPSPTYLLDTPLQPTPGSSHHNLHLLGYPVQTAVAIPLKTIHWA